MTIIQLNNENTTKVEFTYDSGIPYKEEIRPECEYGDWKEKPDYCLIKMFLCDDELKHFKNKKEIKFTDIHFFKNEIWIYLEDCYAVLNRNDYLENKINENSFVIAFFHNKKHINAWGFS